MAVPPPPPPNGIGSPGTWAESHPESIWVQVGLPLLKENPKIIEINWVDADSHSWQVVCWYMFVPLEGEINIDRNRDGVFIYVAFSLSLEDLILYYSRQQCDKTFIIMCPCPRFPNLNHRSHHGFTAGIHSGHTWYFGFCGIV